MPTPVKISGNPPTIQLGSGSDTLDFPLSWGGQTFGPFYVGSAVYLVACDPLYDVAFADVTLHMYKSSDSGSTWAEVDSGNAPAEIYSYQSFTFGTTIRVVILGNSRGPGVEKLGTILFDTLTDTWGSQDLAPVPIVPDRVDWLFAAAFFANGDLITVYVDDASAGNRAFNIRRRVSGVWQEPVVAWTEPVSVVFGTTMKATGSLVIDESDGSAYVLYGIVLTLLVPNLHNDLYVYMRQVSSVDAVSAQSLVVYIPYAGRNVFLQNFGTLTIWQNKLIVPCSFVVVGSTPYAGIFESDAVSSNPVWTIKQATDAEVQVLDILLCNFLVVDAQTAYLVFSSVSGSPYIPSDNCVWVALYNGTTFESRQRIYNWNTDPPAGSTILPDDQYIWEFTITMSPTGEFGLVMWLLYEYDLSDDPVGSFFFLTNYTPPPPVRVPLKGVGAGGTIFPRFLNVTLLLNQLALVNPPLSSFFLFPNDYDLCLARDWTLYRNIDRQALSCMKKPSCFCLDEREWVETPKGGRVFNPSGSIPLPAPGSDTVIFSFTIPDGYDGIITGHHHGFTSTGFKEFSGDLEWRIKVSGRYLRDCGAILTTIGSPRQVSPIEGGYRVYSGNLIQYIVSAPNTSGGLNPMGNIIAGIHGWAYPRT